MKFVFGSRNVVDDVGVTTSDEKVMLRNAIISVSHMIYLDWCFEAMDGEKK